ncbi:MAG: AAA family ATPase [Mariprofundaceae bacterium]|nr:AAA family ATPase [Mariprofundaceae bacterium]
MASKHIRSISIENFKCFKKLSISKFGNVNLIGGKNNVGKTSFLEAIELLSGATKAQDLIYQIRNMLQRRQQEDNRPRRFIELDFMHDDSQFLLLESNIRRCEIKFEERSSDESKETLFSDDTGQQYDLYLNISVNDDERRIPTDLFLSDRAGPIIRRSFENYLNNLNYIKSSKTDERRISLLYGSLVDLNKEEYLNRSLQLFDESLLAIKQRATERGVTLKVQKKDRESPVLLSSLGDGVNRYIAILCAIWASENGILFIDEIENGIHYSNYKKLWKLIFQTAKEANCQIFVTSHSKECIQEFNNYQIRGSEGNGLYFELFRSKKNNLIKAIPRDHDQLQYALAHDEDIRGE